jgi:molybdopterin-guanine dinucleotide biosynthesis protein A
VNHCKGTNFSAVILAGGQSRRMGRDKAWLPLAGKSLLARQVELVRQLGPAEVFIAGRADTDYRALGCRVLTDRFLGAGPLAGLERALEATTTPLLLVLAVDLPNLTVPFLRRLADGCAGEAGVVPRHAGHLEPLVAFYPKVAWPVLVELLDEHISRSPPDLAKTAVSGLSVAREPGVRSPSATRFVELCAAAGLVSFMDVSAADAHCFANWNSQADLVASQVSAPRPLLLSTP